ncbi:MAG: DUF3726 domain-containing protein [Marivivens sp.]|nr:DUF3726 domain-containing protein [Marivivens sp.]
MILSLSEIEGLAKKAARGAGYSWGIAEDAGRDVRWLEGHGLPGAGVLAGLLIDNDGPRNLAKLPPRFFDGRMQPGGEGPMCPITAAAAISDRWEVLTREIVIGPVQWPILLLPAVARSAVALGMPLTMSWFGYSAVARPDGSVSETGLRRGASVTDHLKIMPVDQAGAVDPCNETDRCATAPVIVDQLNIFAGRTYAPATEASRLAGAGAGLTDND